MSNSGVQGAAAGSWQPLRIFNGDPACEHDQPKQNHPIRLRSVISALRNPIPFAAAILAEKMTDYSVISGCSELSAFRNDW